MDRGIRTISIYAEHHYLTIVSRLCEQAAWAGIDIRDVYSNVDGETLHFNPEERNIKVDYSVKNIYHDSKDLQGSLLTMGRLFRSVPAECRNFSRLFSYSFRKHVLWEPVLKYKRSQGLDRLKVVCMYQPIASAVRNPTHWEQKLAKWSTTPQERIMARRKALGITEEEDYFHPTKDFTHDFTEYKRDGIWWISDIASDPVNAVGGYRVTTDVPERARHDVFTFGPSFCFGSCTPDKHTIQSTLQRAINQKIGANAYRVWNCANAGWPNLKKQCDSFLYHRPQNGDIVIFMEIGEPDSLEKELYKDRVLFVDPQGDDRLFDRPHEYGDVFSNTDVHLTPRGYDLVGKYLFEKMNAHGILMKKAKIGIDQDNVLPKNNEKKWNDGARCDSSIAKSVFKYVESIRGEIPKIGCIVMNCNPFTLGHRHLVEYAANQVEEVIIFVVQEDKSVFRFEDRIRLVKQGVADLTNVTVVPSGGYIISQVTFGAYFEKGSMQEEKIDPTNDVRIFGKYIAPPLGITVRFAGEEPLDNVTRQYNEAMKKILPKYGVEFRVIPRKTYMHEPISASKVRELLEAGDMQSVHELVPKTTYDFLELHKEEYRERDDTASLA